MPISTLAIRGLQGISTQDGTSKLVCVYGNDYHLLNTTFNTFQGQGIPTTNYQKVRSASFLDKAFFTDGYNVSSAGSITVGDDTKRFDGSTFSNEYVTKRLPLAKIVHQLNNNIYYANLYFKATAQQEASMVWTNDLPVNNDITYGFEEGTHLSVAKGSSVVRAAQADFTYFITRNIKVGDPLFILTGSSKGEYTVASVDSESQITLNETIPATETVSFWVGSNYVRFSPNNNDEIAGLGDNNNRLLVFKNDSLYRYTPGLSASAVKLKGVPGTSSHESIININEYTYYMHRTGIWRTDGTSAELVSRPIQDWVEGINPTALSDAVGWPASPTKEIYRVYVGDITNKESGISIRNAYLEYDAITKNCSVGKLPFGITAKTIFVENGSKNVYLGTDDGRVCQVDMGNDDMGTSIEWLVDTGFHFPEDSLVEMNFEKFLVHTRYGRGVEVRYKLYGNPYGIDDQWHRLGDITNAITEFKKSDMVQDSNIGRGIAFLMVDNSNDKRPVVERIDIFYRVATARSL